MTFCRMATCLTVSEVLVHEHEERLLSAREAALWLEANPRTAQLRARRALLSGEPAVQTIAGAYCAPAWWWKTTLAKPIKVGRPGTRDI